MEFRTSIKVNKIEEPIKHSDELMLIGSCFSDNVGARFADAMMNVMVNPLGTVYNPLSIASAVSRIVECHKVQAEELFEANGVWNSFDFHSRFSQADAAITLGGMNAAIEAAHEHLKHCKWLFVTLGTAIIYSRGEVVVANCHKLPAAQFRRRMLGVSEVEDALKGIISQLKTFNSELKVVFTVSPIRHIADGLEQNSLSKSTLRVAVGDVVAQSGSDCRYFPSFEIVNDDLRDYRFYAADMVHPGEVAVEYIWEVLREAYFDEQSQRVIERCERMTKRLRHRPMSANPEVVAQFRADTEAALSRLLAEYPYIARYFRREK